MGGRIQNGKAHYSASGSGDSGISAQPAEARGDRVTWYRKGAGHWERLMIPATPLLEYLESRGGLQEVINNGIQGGRNHPDFKMDREPARTPEYRKYEAAFRRAAALGYIDLFYADEFIVQYLRVHPCDVYGWDWFEYGNDTEAVETMEVAA